MSWFEKVLAQVSPSWALKRQRDRVRLDLLNSYKGADRRRDAQAGWRTLAKPADDDILPDLPTLRSNSRDLLRNNPIAVGVSNTKVTNVVGRGLRVQPVIDREFLKLSDQQADDFEGEAERGFTLWAESVNSDLERTLTFAEQQELAFRSTLENGDHIVSLTGKENPEWPFRLALQHAEADRLCNPNNAADTPNLVAGVEKDSDGAPVTYHIARYHPYALVKGDQSWTPLPAFSSNGRPLTLHLFRKLRSRQTRGVPDLTPIIEPLKQMDRYLDAELEASVKEAIWALLVKTETGEGLAGLTYDNWKDVRKSYYDENSIEVKEGSSGIVGLFPDDSIEAFSPSRPNSSFDAFMQALYTNIGMALELPQEVVMKRFQSSYSAARASLLQAIQFYLGRRAWLARRLCQPVYEAFLWERVVSGSLSAPGFLRDVHIRAAYSRAEWLGDSFGNIDESRAIQASRERIELDISTKTRETALHTGESWDKVHQQRQKELRVEGES